MNPRRSILLPKNLQLHQFLQKATKRQRSSLHHQEAHLDQIVSNDQYPQRMITPTPAIEDILATKPAKMAPKLVKMALKPKTRSWQRASPPRKAKHWKMTTQTRTATAHYPDDALWQFITEIFLLATSCPRLPADLEGPQKYYLGYAKESHVIPEAHMLKSANSCRWHRGPTNSLKSCFIVPTSGGTGGTSA